MHPSWNSMCRFLKSSQQEVFYCHSIISVLSLSLRLDLKYLHPAWTTCPAPPCFHNLAFAFPTIFFSLLPWYSIDSPREILLDIHLILNELRFRGSKKFTESRLVDWVSITCLNSTLCAILTVHTEPGLSLPVWMGNKAVVMRGGDFNWVNCRFILLSHILCAIKFLKGFKF